MDKAINFKFGQYEIKELENNTVVIEWLESPQHEPVELCRAHFGSGNELIKLGAFLSMAGVKLDDLEFDHPMGQS
jgi:hypothetical protein